MKVTVDLRVLELLSSRLCHELISPVGAINNGIELMGEDDPDFVKDATKLIANSARSAGNRLNFYRFAYGSGRAGTGREVTLGLLEGGKARCEWGEAVSALPVEWQRLACNMVVLAAEALPRGGSIEVGAAAGKPGLSVKAAGDSVNIAAEMRAALDGSVAVADLTARSVHAYYTARLAEALDVRLRLAEPQAGSAVFAAG
ncbi:MAG TPA: histidine phosphotransferase family protein [Stellaceae bacterium]|nr:histidine phosphotransferase family protein [Stellaceae bacterium]